MKKDAPEPPLPTEPMSPRGKRAAAAGGVAALAGLALVPFADAAGKNLFSVCASLLLIAGCAVIGAGLLLPDAQTPPRA